MKKYLGGLLALVLLIISLPRAVTAADSGWQDTGFPFANLIGAKQYCVDPMQPDSLLWGVPGKGTMAFNWRTHATTFVGQRVLTLCTTGTYLYGEDLTEAAPFRYWRFNSFDRDGRVIPRLPTHVAHDGSLLVYRLDPPQVTAGGVLTQPGHLWASADGGLTWQERGQQFRGHVESLALAEADAHVLYALTVDRPPAITQPVPYTVWSSTDAGLTWAHGEFAQMDRVKDAARYTSADLAQAPRLLLDVVPGPTAPVGQVLLTARYAYKSSDPAQPANIDVDFLRLSTDRGQTFADSGCRRCDTYTSKAVDLAQVAAGLLKATSTYYLDSHGGGIDYRVSRSADGGKTWAAVAEPAGDSVPITVPAAPANVLWQHRLPNSGLDYSSDSGQTWRALAADGDFVAVTPYLPLTVLRLTGGTLQVLELPDAGRSQVAPVANLRQAPTGADFPATGHYVPAVLLDYWQKNGGLAQFGYPRTEAFREVSDTDGHVYLTQYFERARLEYHPEYAGTLHAVLLGLLGNQLTAQRRAAGDTAFAPLPVPHDPRVLYFAQTGHTLGTAFRTYWETRGGVAIYGYPISEEFQEVSATDGKPYTVQYFERNRFEYHPEHAGTPYEVLLGLLGNTLLEQKGWR